jgi:hypothetical protein
VDVVYRYRKTGNNEDELRYSLRSLSNLPHSKVWIAGDLPAWVKDVGHIPTSQASNKWEDSRQNVAAACKHPEVSDQFVLMDDDFFVIQPIDEVPALHRGEINDLLAAYARKHSTYRAGFADTAKMVFAARGMQNPALAYNLHVPMVLDKQKVLQSIEALDALDVMRPKCFHFRTWYGNYAHQGGTKSSDVKIVNSTESLPSGPFLSTTRASFNSAGKLGRSVRAMFRSPSPYESR